MKHVTRYVVTMPWTAGGKGWRQLAHPAQGRHTFETAAEAHAWIDAARRNTSADTLRSVYGGAGKLAVCACVCWANHHDPVGVYFPPGSELAPDEAEAETIDAAHGVTIAPVPASECGAGSTEWDVFREGEHVSSHETRDAAAQAAQNLADDLNAALAEAITAEDDAEDEDEDEKRPLADWIAENRETIRAAVLRVCPNAPTGDEDLADWIANDEGLYSWAVRDGVDV